MSKSGTLPKWATHCSPGRECSLFILPKIRHRNLLCHASATFDVAGVFRKPLLGGRVIRWSTCRYGITPIEKKKHCKKKTRGMFSCEVTFSIPGLMKFHVQPWFLSAKICTFITNIHVCVFVDSTRLRWGRGNCKEKAYFDDVPLKPYSLACSRGKYVNRFLCPPCLTLNQITKTEDGDYDTFVIVVEPWCQSHVMSLGKANRSRRSDCHSSSQTLQW